jgi:sulfane dehydrogenase subunit SoxC
LRDPEGNMVVDWTGSPQWESYRKQSRAIGGPAYGTREKDWRLYGYRSRYVTSFRLGTKGTSDPAPTTVKTPFLSLLSPLQYQTGIITPTSLHFVDEHGFEQPDIDPRQHFLIIHGLVDRPLKLSMDDITRLPSVSRVHSMECNSDGTNMHRTRLEPFATPGDIYGEYSCSEWTGVLLSKILEMAGVQKGASWIWAEASDSFDHAASIPLEKAMDDCIVAYGQNGEPLRPENGFPLRLVTPGWEGMRNPKRLAKIKVTNEPGMFMRETSLGYTDLRADSKIRWFRFEMGAKSVILQPSGGQQLKGRGFYEIRGIAWSGGGKVRKVEITTDGGKTWKDAQLQEPIFSKAATRFVYPWTWNGEEVMLASRCIDERGSTQPTTAEMAKVVQAKPEDLRTTRVWRFNVIQPWKIDREGKVTNAILAI